MVLPHAALFLLVGSLAGMGCGDAINASAQATSHMCDRAEACSQIHAGQTYVSRSDCETKLRKAWQEQWPPADCDGHIDTARFQACLTTIDIIQCADIPNGVLSAALACDKDRVCSLNPGK